MTPKTDHDMLVELHTAVCGVDGQNGLLRSHQALKTDYYNFKRWVMGIIAFLVGSGAIGFGAFKMFGG